MCRLPSELLERVRAYVEELRALWADELEGRWQALEDEHQNRSVRRSLRWLPLLIVAIPMSCGAMFDTLATHHTGMNIGIVAVWLLGYGMVVYGMRPACPTVTRMFASGLGGCWSCGAPIRFAEGDAVAQCRHCGSSAVVDAELERKMIQAASERLSIVLGRSERASLQALASQEHAGAVYGIGGKASLAGVQAVSCIVFLTGAFIYFAATGKLDTRGDAPSAWVTPALIGGTVLVTVGVALSMRARLQRRSQALRQLEGMTGRSWYRTGTASKAERERAAEELLARIVDDETMTTVTGTKVERDASPEDPQRAHPDSQANAGLPRD